MIGKLVTWKDGKQLFEGRVIDMEGMMLSTTVERRINTETGYQGGFMDRPIVSIHKHKVNKVK